VLKILAIPAFVVAALVVMGQIGALSTSVVHAQTTDFSITGPTSVAVGDSFHVTVDLDSLPADYVGYQAKLFYDDVELDAVGLPASWNSAPTGTTGGNVMIFPNGPDCGPAPGGNALQDNDLNGDTTEDDLGTNSLLMFCNDNAVAPISTTGPLVDFYFTCEAAGTASLTLADQATDPQGGTKITDGGFIPQGDNYGTLDVTCAEATATNTPEPPTATNTPAPPTATNTPVPGTRIEKLPEGNGNNVDLSDPNLPLANLWLSGRRCRSARPRA
jgi:hypothetical protein